MSDEQRVSDSDRELAVARLREASTAGRLTLEELSDRTGLAYEARTHGELVHVTADLPATPTQPLQGGKRTSVLVGLFVPVVRRGRRVRGRTIALSLFAPCLVDYRAATYSNEGATLFVLSLFGPVKVTVPEQVDVDMSVISIFSPTIESGSPDSLSPEAPSLRVRGLSLFGPVVLQHRRSEGSNH
jgi:uncharacterized protein DUF1707